jgi:hypothetical protein
MKKEKLFDLVTQFAIPILTLGSQIVLSLKYPQWTLLLNFLAQPFWLYSTWKSYKKVGQIGMFINTVAFTIITFAGLINYWILK